MYVACNKYYSKINTYVFQKNISTHKISAQRVGSHICHWKIINENNLFITNLFIFFLSHSYWPLYSQLSRLNLTKQVITSMN